MPNPNLWLYLALDPRRTLCITLACLTNPNLCGMYPTCPLLGRVGLVDPQTSTSPDKGLTIPAIVLRRVVLPIPDGPAMATISPGKISRLGISARGSLGEYPITRFLTLITGDWLSCPDRILLTPPSLGDPKRVYGSGGRRIIPKMGNCSSIFSLADFEFISKIFRYSRDIANQI